MPFRYLRDPLFLLCLVIYFTNRLVLKHLAPGGFLHEHLNDLICIPFWVPIVVWGMRKMGLRRDDAPPHADEIILPLLLWSVIFEVSLPQTRTFRGLATADYLDVLWYTVGALGAAVGWGWWYRERDPLPAG
jgi:hypothetical protein